MPERSVIVWFRQDLRLHDNEALQEALASKSRIYPVFVFDERVFNGKTQFGFVKTGQHRKRFIVESVSALRQNLRSLGSELFIRVGKPEEELFKLAQELKSSWIFCNRERTEEEVLVQDSLEKKLWSIGQEMRYSRGKMLYYTADLPFPVTHTPDSFSSFKKEVEKLVQVRNPFPAPEDLPAVGSEIGCGEIPKFDDVSSSNGTGKDQALDQFRGGENAALQRLTDLVEGVVSSDLKNGMSTDLDDSFTSLSPYLSSGCLSPKKMFHLISNHSTAIGNQSLFEHIFNRLMYRDYIRLMGKKYGNMIFQKHGINGQSPTVRFQNEENLNNWKNGTLGEPLIDAIMNRLNQTGFCNNQARSLAANYLVYDLGIDWRKGASYFESQLIDYDPCSNWVNWMMVAGVGPDQREKRKLNYALQAQRLDPKGSFIDRWS